MADMTKFQGRKSSDLNARMTGTNPQRPLKPRDIDRTLGARTPLAVDDVSPGGPVGSVGNSTTPYNVRG